MCLSNNATADLKECGVDAIPSAEEKCNTQSCDDATPEPTTEAPLVEVCEEVEVDDDGGDEGSGEPGMVAKPTEKPKGKPTEKPKGKPTEKPKGKPTEMTDDKTEESSGSAKDEMMEAGSGAGSAEDLSVGMSAEGSGGSESVCYCEQICKTKMQCFNLKFPLVSVWSRIGPRRYDGSTGSNGRLWRSW